MKHQLDVYDFYDGEISERLWQKLIENMRYLVDGEFDEEKILGEAREVRTFTSLSYTTIETEAEMQRIYEETSAKCDNAANAVEHDASGPGWIARLIAEMSEVGK